MLWCNREGKQVATITEWLASLGMSEYAQRFAENRIDDVGVLRHLTDQDLKDIGVPLGHRRKMLAAAAELPGAASVTSQAVPKEDPRQPTGLRRSPSPQPQAAFAWPRRTAHASEVRQTVSQRAKERFPRCRSNR
jgi:SAM domain (Sterile alpha motif)